MTRPLIRSAANPAVRELRRLIQKPRHRRRQGVAVIEGLREAERAAAAGARLHRLVVAPALLQRGGGALPDVLAAVADRLDVTPDLMARLSRRENPSPVLALADIPGVPLTTLAPPTPECILIAERLEKPGNLGAIARTVAAMGAVLIAADPECDPGNPNLIRASQGAIYEIPFAIAPIGEVRRWLAGRGISLVVADPAAERICWNAPLGGPVALLVGNEAEGVSDEARAAADALVRIPMYGRHTDSLNAATTAALLCYEVIRQRAAG